DRRDASRALDEPCGERGQAGPDLDQVVAGPRIDRIDDPLDVVGVDQEVLAEALAGNVRDQAVRGGACCARTSASSSAATRLPTSAVRSRSGSAARSSAVPWSTDVRTNGNPSVTFTPWPKLAAFRTGSPWS